MSRGPLAECDRVVPAPVDIVWSLVSTASGLTSWMAAEAEVDLTVGGRIRWTHDTGWVVDGVVLEVVPHRLLRFTFGWATGGYPVPLGSSEVRIELEPLGDHTRVRVEHSGLTPEMAAVHTGGWSMFADRLVDVAGRVRR